MASIKCSKCGRGIHYHDEPDGTEWTAFGISSWEELVETASVNVHGEMYVAFEDTEWDEITELDWTTDEIRNGIKDVEHFYLIVDDKAVAVSEDARGTEVKKVYKRIQDVLASTS